MLKRESDQSLFVVSFLAKFLRHSTVFRLKAVWGEVLFSVANLTSCDRPHPPLARAHVNLLHTGLALARPLLCNAPRINLQKLCYTA